MLLARVESIEAYVAVTALAAGLVAVWLLFLVWGRLSGQLDDAEAAKYRLFDDGVPPEREGERAGSRKWTRMDENSGS